MPYEVSRSSNKSIKRNRRPINVHQNNFSKGYVSTYDSSRRPQDSLSDATNIEIVADNIPRPRPSLTPYGTQPDYPVVGRGKYRYNGVRGEFFMLNIGGVGKIHYRVDGGPMTLVGGVNSYNVNLWSGFVQSKDRVYVYNGDESGAGNNLSYVNLPTMATIEYTALVTPATPTATPASGLTSGTKPYNYYYKITANNVVGESAASPASAAANVNKIRDDWDATNSVTVTWSAVTGATSYTIYGGTDPNFLNEIITLSNLTTLQYIDDGSLTLNPFKLAPSSNSTQGYVFTWMYVDKRNAQVFGVTADNKLAYSAAGTGDFSSLNGGGYTTIDEGGDTQLNYVDGFRTGKGDPVITTMSRGAAGKGLVNHVTFEQVTYGDQVIFYPNVIEANGQSGTYAPRATVKAGDSILYPTGDNFKSTGTSQSINNILTTKGIADLIIPDVNKINLSALYGAAGVEYQDKIYFALPVGSDSNNEIWYYDLARKGIWILRWTVAAKDIWLYEDSLGTSHLCVLVNNMIQEFTRTGTTASTDNGVPFRSRAAFSSLVWDEDGVSLGNINKTLFKLLQPSGAIQANTYGLTKRGASTNNGTGSYSVSVSYTGYEQFDWSGDYFYDQDPGNITAFSNSIAVLTLRPKGLLNQMDWEVVTETAGCDYQLSSVNTRGMSNLDLIYRGI